MPDPKHSLMVWFCHECADGPLSCYFSVHCSSCGHVRCELCRQERMWDKGMDPLPVGGGNARGSIESMNLKLKRMIAEAELALANAKGDSTIETGHSTYETNRQPAHQSLTTETQTTATTATAPSELNWQPKEGGQSSPIKEEVLGPGAMPKSELQSQKSSWLDWGLKKIGFEFGYDRSSQRLEKEIGREDGEIDNHAGHVAGFDGAEAKFPQLPLDPRKWVIVGGSDIPISAQKEREEDGDCSEAGSISEIGYELTEFLVDCILQEVALRLKGTPLDELAAILPELLQEFAVRLGHEGRNEENRTSYWRLMYLAYKKEARARLALQLEHSSWAPDGSGLIDLTISSATNPRSDKSLSGPLDGAREEEEAESEERATRILDWLHDPLLDTESSDDFATNVDGRYEEYKATLTGSTAMHWLIGTANRRVSCDGDCSSMENARQQLKRGISKPKGVGTTISRSRAPPVFRGTIRLSWNPALFLSLVDTHSLYSHEQSISDTLTVTGSDGRLQALPCSAYMRQIWPISSGAVIKTVERLARPSRNDVEFHIQATTDDGTEIDAYRLGSDIIFRVTGTFYGIAEITEQLAWMASALQVPEAPPLSQRSQPQIEYKTAVISLASLRRSNLFYLKVKSVAVGSLGMPSIDSAAHCWKGLFTRASVAFGFPVLKRPRDVQGLEIPLGIAAEIIGAEKVTPFKEKLIIKGHSALMFPTRSDDQQSLITWHLITNESDERISYADPRAFGDVGDHSPCLSPKSLQSARHIVGWSENVRTVAGTSLGSYSVGYSSACTPRSGWVLEKFELSGGQYITATAGFTRDNRMRPLKVSYHKDLYGSIEWLANQHVILHDTHDRRAWLVDGVTTLLYLARASVELDRKGPMAQLYCTTFDLDQPNGDLSGRRTSIDILANKRNLNYILRDTGEEDTTEKYTLRQRVKELFDYLEQIFDHQADMEYKRGVGWRIAGSPWDHLEGFDFLDIAQRHRSIKPKGLVLKEHGRGWFEFTRSIHAITLFGQGFGDILQPIVRPGDRTCLTCHWNSPAPKGLDTLAVSAENIIHIKRLYPAAEEAGGSSWQIGQDIIWETPDDSFKECECLPGQTISQRIQSFQKSKGKGRRSHDDVPNGLARSCISPTGGILLGYSPNRLKKATGGMAGEAGETRPRETGSSSATSSSPPLSTSAEVTSIDTQSAEGWATDANQTRGGKSRWGRKRRRNNAEDDLEMADVPEASSSSAGRFWTQIFGKP